MFNRMWLCTILILLLASPTLAAPFLTWDAVTTGSDGSPLGAGLTVTSYKVYQCGPSAAACTGASRLLVATVIAPTTQFDLASTATPMTYIVTAVNIVGESADSATLKVVKPDLPKNPRLQ